MTAEAMGVLRDLQFAKDSGLLPAMLETGAQVVVTAINNPTVILSEVGLVIHDIVELLRLCPNSRIMFMPRSTNLVAHSLAKFALGIERDCFWMEDYPDCIRHSLVANNQVSS
ncbi:hypothetical protein ACOSP7_018124 [Xanthoceras sorbifolium]